MKLKNLNPTQQILLSGIVVIILGVGAYFLDKIVSSQNIIFIPILILIVVLIFYVTLYIVSKHMP